MKASTAYADAAAASAAAAAQSAAVASANSYTNTQPQSGATLRADVGAGLSVVLVNDVGAVAYVPTTAKHHYQFRITLLFASEGNVPTIGVAGSHELRVEAYQLAAGNLVIDATSAALNSQNPHGYTLPGIAATSSANGLVLTWTNQHVFTVRVVATVEILSFAVSL